MSNNNIVASPSSSPIITTSPSTIKWENNFWGDGNQGFDALSNRMDSGQESLNEILSFFREWSRLNEKHASNLKQISTEKTFKADEGTLQNVLKELSAAANNMAGIHLELSSIVQQELKTSVEKIQSDYNDLRKAQDNVMEKANKERLAEITNLGKARVKYEQKCRALTISIQNVNRGQTSSMSKKEFKTIQDRAVQAKKDMDTAEVEYKEAIENANVAQTLWENKLAAVAEEIHKIERMRIEQTKKALLKVMTVFCKNLSQRTAEEFVKFRGHIETVSPGADLDGYVERIKTGSERAKRFEFTNFFSSSPKNNPLPATDSLLDRLKAKARRISQGGLLGNKVPTTPEFNLKKSKSELRGPTRSATEPNDLQVKSTEESSPTFEDQQIRVMASSLVEMGSPMLASTINDDMQMSSTAEIRSNSTRESSSKSEEESDDVRSLAKSDRTLDISLNKKPKIITALTHDPFSASEQTLITNSMMKISSINERSPDSAIAVSPIIAEDQNNALRGKDTLPTSASLHDEIIIKEKIVTTDDKVVLSVESITLSQHLSREGDSKDDENRTKSLGRRISIKATTKEGEPDIQTSLPSMTGPASGSSIKNHHNSSYETIGTRTFTRKSIKMEGWIEYFSEFDFQWLKGWAVLEGGFIWIFHNEEEAKKPQGTVKTKNMISLAKCQLIKGKISDISKDPEERTKALNEKPDELVLSFVNTQNKSKILAFKDDEEYQTWFLLADQTIQSKKSIIL